MQPQPEALSHPRCFALLLLVCAGPSACVGTDFARDDAGPDEPPDASPDADAVDARPDVNDSEAEGGPDASDADAAPPDAGAPPPVTPRPVAVPDAIGKALSAAQVVAGSAVQIDADGQTLVMFSLPIQAQLSGTSVHVVLVDASGKVSKLPASQTRLDNQEVVVVTREPGIYAAIAEIKPACTALTLKADLTLQNAAGLSTKLQGGRSLAEVTHLEGDLQVGGSLASLEGLPCLTFVTGNVLVQNGNELTQVILPALASVGGYVQIQALPKLTKVSLPQLMRVGRYPGSESVFLRTLPELTRVDLPSLVQAPGGIELTTLSATADQKLSLDLKALQRLGGSLTLNGVYSLTDLTGLGRLLNVDGSIELRGNPDLESLEGLSALTKLDGSLIVLNNAALKAARLPALEHVSGYLQFQDDAKLASIDVSQLRNLGRYPGGESAFLRNLPELTSFNMAALGETPGGLELTRLSATADSTLSLHFDRLSTVRGNVAFNAVSGLASMESLQTLRNVEGSIDVSNATNLKSLALGAVQKLAGSLIVHSNPALESVSFPVLTSVDGYVQVENDATLRTIDLSKLDTIGRYPGGESIFLRTLPELTGFRAGALGELPGGLEFSSLAATADAALTFDLGALRVVRGSVALHSLARLSSLEGFSKLAEINGSLDIRSSMDLASFAGLGMLHTLGDNLIVIGNAGLAAASLPALAQIGGYVQFENCAKLTKVELSVLTTLGRYPGGPSIILRTLAALDSLDASSLGETPGGLEFNTLAASTSGELALRLPALRLVRGPVELNAIRKSPALSSLMQLTQIDGDLTIRGCPDLTSLEGLGGLTTLAGSLTITNNPQLPTCVALAFRDRVRPIGSGTSQVNGNYADACTTH